MNVEVSTLRAPFSKPAPAGSPRRPGVLAWLRRALPGSAAGHTLNLSVESRSREHDHGAHDHEHDHGDHGHEHGGHDHGHGHDYSHDYRELGRRRLSVSLVLILTYMVAEIVGGIISGSLALVADALHMLTDGAAIALALFAIWLAGKPATVERTFGYQRAEVLAALINALSLWLVASWVFFEAYHRFFVESPGEIEGVLVLVVGGGGLLINIIVAYILHASAGHSLNAEGAFQHVRADLVGSVGVIIAAVLIMTLSWNIADPIISVFIGLLIIYSSRGLIGKVFHVLLEGTPRHIDPYRLCSQLEEVEGVTVIHDVHVSTVTSGYDQLSAHILADPAYEGDYDQMLRRLRRIASEEFGISHITIQLETSVQGCTEVHHVDHLAARARQKKS